MKRRTIYFISASIMIASLLITACGAKNKTDNAPDSAIATAVAQTVAAQNAETSSAPATPIFTQTPLQFPPTLTPLAPITFPTLPINNTAHSECGQASLVSETIPDDTIFRPGEQFTKTWEIKNLSACTWDTSYKIVFFNGDVLGGGYTYNFPQVVPPDGTVPISLVLTAPATDGSYKSEWKLQTPGGFVFGLGQYSTPFYTKIIVSSTKRPKYAVTSVDYNIVRDPAYGCPTNTRYTVYATFTTNGPIEFTYFWDQSDGNESGKKTIIMDAAGTKTISRDWLIHIGNATNPRWMQIIITAPTYQEFSRAVFDYTCQQ